MFISVSEFPTHVSSYIRVTQGEITSSSKKLVRTVGKCRSGGEDHFLPEEPEKIKWRKMAFDPALKDKQGFYKKIWKSHSSKKKHSINW